MGTNGSKEELSEEGQIILEYINGMKLFEGESVKQLSKVAAALKLLSYKKGDIIIKQNDESEFLCIIVKGKVCFTQTDAATGRRIEVAEVGAEETFGEFGLVYNIRRISEAVASSDNLLVLRLDRHVYNSIKNTKYMKPISRKVESVCKNLLSKGLLDLPLLRGYKSSDINELINLFRFEIHPKGSAIIKEGQKPSRFYLVFRGELVVTRVDEFTLPYEIVRIRKGEGFGERALLNKAYADSTVTSLETCQLFSLDGDEFESFINEMSAAEKAKLQTSSYNSMMVKSVPIFGHLQGTSLNMLGISCISRTYRKGDVIIVEDTTDNRKVSIIVSGKVSVKKNGVQLTTMSSGYFGEAQIFRKAPSASTITAISKLVVLQVPVETFELVLNQEPVIKSEVALKILGKSVSLQTVIQHPNARQVLFKFCAKEFSQESIEFLEDIRKLELLEHRSLAPEVERALLLGANFYENAKQRLLRDKTRRIYGEYIQEGSVNEINISADRKSEVKKLIDNDELSFRMFNGVKNDILNLTEQDTFSRFTTSQLFKDFLNDFGLYSL